ncbi:hypothetical protein C8A05DRAFT_14220, partial [Staphylotrichum tortipilum]
RQTKIRPHPHPPTSHPQNPPTHPDYTSLPVALPPTFLTTPAPDSLPITTTPIDFSTTPLPEYAGLYALVLDHVLSPSECATLISLAEASVPEGSNMRGEDGGAWGPAMVNVGGGFEVLETGYRNGERIVWDCEEVVGRIWSRCLEGEGVREQLGVVEGADSRVVSWGSGGRWVVQAVNERMRFLRYGVGGFFRPHCDGSYHDTRDPARVIRTLFTVHLYLNDSKAEVPGAELVGGATTFFSSDEKRRLDVNPKAGRVLIFQHRRLYHSGDDVLAGTKYTMRTDILYEFISDKEEEERKQAEGKAKAKAIEGK